MTDKISNSVNFIIDRVRFDKIFPYSDAIDFSGKDILFSNNFLKDDKSYSPKGRCFLVHDLLEEDYFIIFDIFLNRRCIGGCFYNSELDSYYLSNLMLNYLLSLKFSKEFITESIAEEFLGFSYIEVVPFFNRIFSNYKVGGFYFYRNRVFGQKIDLLDNIQISDTYPYFNRYRYNLFELVNRGNSLSSNGIRFLLMKYILSYFPYYKDRTFEVVNLYHKDRIDYIRRIV